MDKHEIPEEIQNILMTYKSHGFTFRLRAYIMSLPRNKIKLQLMW